MSKGLNSARICFTCHNFEYQGAASASNLGSCGLDVYHLNRPDRMQDHSANDRVNPVKVLVAGVHLRPAFKLNLTVNLCMNYVGLISGCPPSTTFSLFICFFTCFCRSSGCNSVL